MIVQRAEAVNSRLLVPSNPPNLLFAGGDMG